ncbi:MAG: RtcB family protein [Candidatus Anstonellales archaeon]
MEKIGNCIYKIEKNENMNVDAIVIANEKLLQSIQKDRTLWQIKNVASLPGIVDKAVLMPDAHEGYGFPVGGVAAFDANNGIISPGGIGYDINCGVRIVKTPLTYDDVKNKLKDIAEMLFKNIPTGVGASTGQKISFDELDEIATNGIKWAIEKGFGIEKDIEFIEENGCIKGADPKYVSQTAKSRGREQIGTLGAGNHFLEVQRVSKIFYDEAAKHFGIYENQIVIMIHSGSRGYGHQIASDYIKDFMPIAKKLGLYLPDQELVYLPITHEKTTHYLNAMKCAINFAFTNRQVMCHKARVVFEKIFGLDYNDMPLLYDLAHNIAKIEEHDTSEGKKKLIVHRKGATRAFPKNRDEIPNAYKSIGQPVLIPGSMGTASYILIGQEMGMNISFGSSCHGAGRELSRSAALKQFKGETIVKQLLEKKGIYVKPKTYKVAAEEAPEAYKNVDEVAKSVEQAGISRIVAKLEPLAVIKG